LSRRLQITLRRSAATSACGAADFSAGRPAASQDLWIIESRLLFTLAK
jgi:hypothetical protein